MNRAAYAGKHEALLYSKALFLFFFPPTNTQHTHRAPPIRCQTDTHWEQIVPCRVQKGRNLGLWTKDTAAAEKLK